MKNYLSMILIIFCFATSPMMGQADVKIKKSEFRGEKAGFKEAWSHINNGDAAYLKKGRYYTYAFDNYLQAIVYNSLNPELNYKTGISAIYTDHKEEAAGFFLKALDYKPDVADDILLYAGRALQYTGSYEDAVMKLTSYIKSPVRKTEENLVLAKRFLEECNSAILLTQDKKDFEILNAGGDINSGEDDFSPVLTWDGNTIYFASSRKTGRLNYNTGIERTDENIYFSRLVNGKWSLASLAGEGLITDYNESPLYIDSAETKLYLYSGFENGGDIKVSLNKKGDWRTPESIPFNINSIGSETSIAFSESEDEIYFVTSDGKDNLGGFDIYFITRLNDRKWSKPQNAGPAVNSPYDEQGVSLSVKGDTLWFSSRGHNSMGGFDIFYSVRNQDGSWQQAINAGYPLNTPRDEMFRSSYESSGSWFYFASNRTGGLGGFDIYKGRFVPRLSDKKSDMPSDSLPDYQIVSDSSHVIPVSDSSLIEIPPLNSGINPRPGAPLDENDFSAKISLYFLKQD